MIWFKKNLWIVGGLLLFIFFVAIGLVGTGIDAYLLNGDELRMYYRGGHPISVGEENWVVVFQLPDWMVQEEMIGFFRYALTIVVCIVLLFSVLLVYSRFRWRKEYEKRQKLEQEALQLDLQQLKNQINPHFLFNSLNSLSALISTDSRLAKAFVLHLSKIYRYVLEKKGVSLVAVAEEMKFIHHYYFLQQIRFRDQLQLQIEKRLEQEERQIPVMSLQMLVENAIKHNEITHEHPLKIRIYGQLSELIVENEYNPRLDATEHSFGVGFENIRKIYEYCSDKQFHYLIKEGKFICILPLI